jgi:hypothetical protein
MCDPVAIVDGGEIMDALWCCQGLRDAAAPALANLYGKYFRAPLLVPAGGVMKRRRDGAGWSMVRRIISAFAVVLVAICDETHAQVVQLFDPASFDTGAIAIDFEGHVDGQRANELYKDVGLSFQNAGDATVPLLNWSELSRSTSSPDYVIATISTQTGSVFTTHLDVSFAIGATELGAFFGNDQFASFSLQQLEVFDRNHDPIGSVSVRANGNTSVDQFIGLRSEVPFYFARFLNDSHDLSVVLDDLKFTSVVPEPSTLNLMLAGIAACWLFAKGWTRKRWLVGAMEST